MKVRATLAAVVMAALSGAGVANAQSDVEAVTATSKAFYVALAALDGGVAMAKVWAQVPYITYAGPEDKGITVGWGAQHDLWQILDRRYKKRTISLNQQFIHVNGPLGWEMGNESGEVVVQGGAIFKVDSIVTNVFERQPDGRWLMVSHHAQPKPQ
jgi:ketosteroid isomerase-like protein